VGILCVLEVDVVHGAGAPQVTVQLSKSNITITDPRIEEEYEVYGVMTLQEPIEEDYRSVRVELWLEPEDPDADLSWWIEPAEFIFDEGTTQHDFNITIWPHAGLEAGEMDVAIYYRYSYEPVGLSGSSSPTSILLEVGEYRGAHFTVDGWPYSITEGYDTDVLLTLINDGNIGLSLEHMFEVIEGGYYVEFDPWYVMEYLEPFSSFETYITLSCPDLDRDTTVKYEGVLTDSYGEEYDRQEFEIELYDNPNPGGHEEAYIDITISEAYYFVWVEGDSMGIEIRVKGSTNGCDALYVGVIPREMYESQWWDIYYLDREEYSSNSNYSEEGVYVSVWEYYKDTSQEGDWSSFDSFGQVSYTGSGEDAEEISRELSEMVGEEWVTIARALPDEDDQNLYSQVTESVFVEWGTPRDIEDEEDEGTPGERQEMKGEDEEGGIDTVLVAIIAVVFLIGVILVLFIVFKNPRNLIDRMG